MSAPSTVGLCTEPWLSIIGIGENGLADLAGDARAALDMADIVFGGPRHLMLAEIGGKGRAWPVPFSIEGLLAHRGQHVAALVSGDPFWFGAGSVIARALPAGEWRAFAAPSCFSHASAALGWALEQVVCLGLHAAPFEQMNQHLNTGTRLFCLLRGAESPAKLAAYLSNRGAGASLIHVFERLGGPYARHRTAIAQGFALEQISAPVMVAFEVTGDAQARLPTTSGLPDDLFAHDGQITKAPIRAMTLAALAPRAGETLWDIGAGSGSIAIEWCRAGGKAIAIEARSDRAANIVTNAARLAVSDRVTLLEGVAPEILTDLAPPDAIFIGGGACEPVLKAAWQALPAGGRLVINSVTLETEALLMRWSAQKGGTLITLAVSIAAPLGRMRGWQPSRPLLQWSVVK